MKLIASLFVLLFISISVSAQTEADYDLVAIDFTEGYNYLSADKIFNLLDNEYQKTLTLDKVKEFIAQHDRTLGMIKGFGVVSEGNNHKTYLTQFENSSMLIAFELSLDNKITHLSTKEVTIAFAD